MKKIDYKWIISGVCFIMIFVGLGFCSSIQGLFVEPITSALNISRSLFSLKDSCRFISTSVVNIFFGSLVTRFGTKKLIGAGFLSLIISSLIYSFASNVFMFYIGGVFLGIGLSWTTTTMIGCVIGRWFTENRGTVMGAILAANGLGGAVATQILTPIIYNEADKFGFRKAYMLIAVILFVTAVIVLIFFRQSPKAFSKNNVRDGHKKGRGEKWQGIEYSIAVKKKYFYVALVCIFFTGLILQGIIGIAAAHIKDVGISASYLALVMSIHSIFLTVFKFSTGVLYDRFGLKITANICCVSAVAVMLLLAFVTDSPLGKVFAIIYGIFSSLALPLETIMLPIYAADLFGEKSFNKILGIFVSVNTAGYALGAPIMNVFYDALGSYKTALLLASVVMAGVTLALQYVIRKGKQERDAIV